MSAVFFPLSVQKDLFGLEVNSASNQQNAVFAMILTYTVNAFAITCTKQLQKSLGQKIWVENILNKITIVLNKC